MQQYKSINIFSSKIDNGSLNMKINYFVTENTVTLYWDKPDEANANVLYEIFADNDKIGETGKTHFTIDSLAAPLKFLPSLDKERILQRPKKFG